MVLYMAGSTFKELDGWMMQRGYDKLFSQINDREGIKLWVDYRKNNPTHSKLFIDSGAFSVHTQESNVQKQIEKAKKQGKDMTKFKPKKLPYTTDEGKLDVDAYIEFINEMEPYVDIFVQVDHIPGVWGRPRTQQELDEAPIKSWENYKYMRARVNNPDKLLPVFHQGENEYFLKQMLEFRDEITGKQIPYICISTNKDLAIQTQEKWLKDVFSIISKSSNPNIKTHALGLTSLRVLKKYPITSADSTSWLRTATTGSIFTDYGNRCISNETSHREENYANWTKPQQDAFRKYIEDNGYNLDDLIADYKQREMWNIEYLQNWAKNCVYEPRNLENNALF